jgi:glutamate racemase
MRSKALLPIAIFDSGVGGLTVAEALKKKLPNESILYLADTASRPFGTKSEKELRKIIDQNCEFLSSIPIKMLVIACHTACSLGLDLYQRLNVPILGITGSSFLTLTSLDSSLPKIILGTERTISSKIYQKFLSDNFSDHQAYFYSCSCIEKMIETMYSDETLILKELNASLSSISSVKNANVLLACTHFPIYKKYIQKVMDSSCHLIDPAIDFIEQIHYTLQDLKLTNPKTASEDVYLVTENVDPFKKKFFTYFSMTLTKTNHFFNQSCAII